MKKSALLLFLAFCSALANCLAQVENTNFEKLNSDGSLKNWGHVYLFPFSIDSNGVITSDSVAIDQAFYARSSDAYNGNSALELRNGWNYSTNTGIAGAVAADDDSIFSSWGLMNLLPTNATLFAPFAPVNFGFYYKYFPVNGDSAYAELNLWDSAGVEIANGRLLLYDSVSTYTLGYAPINYFNPGFAAYFSLTIHNFFTSQPGYRQPSFGTRLLVDNLGFNFVTLSSQNPENSNSDFSIYPNPARTELKLSVQENTFFEYEILDALGQRLKKGSNQTTIKLNDLSDGFYTLKFMQGEKVLAKKFIKQQ